MVNPFLDPLRPVNGGLNRTRLVDLPGHDLPGDLLGRSGYELLGAAALRTLIRRRLPQLAVDADPLPLLNQQLSAATPRARQAAAGVAEAIGARLGALLLALSAGAAGPRSERSDWDKDHWRYWGGVRRIWLGGGIATGKLGVAIAAAAEDLLQQHGVVDYVVTPAASGARLALLGAARLLPPVAGRHLVFDCGQTRVKAGVATVRNGAVTDLDALATEPGPCTDLWLPERDAAQAQAVWERLVSQLARLTTAAQPGPSPLTMVTALACRISAGHPRPREWMTCYGRLQLVADHLESALGKALADACGRPVALRLVQDATAAALVYAGGEDGVVLTLGTALGTGYVPVDDGLLPLRNVDTR